MQAIRHQEAKKIDSRLKAQIIIVITAALCIGYFSFYKSIYVKNLDLKKKIDSIQDQLLKNQTVILENNVIDGKWVLLEASQYSVAINEIAQAGKQVDIVFVVLGVKENRAKIEEQYKTVPIYMIVEANYQSLGEFLNSFNSFEKSIVTVEKILIERDEKIMPLVRAEIILNLFTNIDSHERKK